LIKTGKIPGTKFGHKWLVSEDDFKALVERLQPPKEEKPTVGG